ncbi:SpoIIE family protein phosphatase [Cellulomonas sp.]|uniref:SpoIIE family protein phosphatase n=1 Tax=Cellulomonas sp. TaxID=40001 RepID=UPI003BACFADF
MPPPGRSEAWDVAPVALLRLDGDGVIVDANVVLLEWVGRTAQDVLAGVRLSELLSVGGRIYWETHLSPLLHMQGRVDEVAVELRGAAGRLPVLLSAVVRTLDGDRRMVDVALSRATERSRYERELLAARAAADRSTDQLRALQATTAALSRGVGADGVARALVRTAVAGLGASAATVWIAAEDGTLVRTASAGSATGVGLADPPDEPWAPGPHAATGPPPGPVEAVEVHAGGVLVVALGDPAAPLGTLVLVPRAGQGDDPLDVGVLTAVGQQAGLALERARMFDQKASVAHELQHALLTTNLPPDDRFTVVTEYRPGVQALEVGGDWYDAFLLDDDVLAVAVGDVVGRGLHAATAMGQLRSAVRAVAGPGVGPAELVRRLDRFVARAGVGFMATLAYAEIDLTTGRVRYACAGHLPPLRFPAHGAPAFLWEGRSTPLGVRSVRTEAEVDLDPADLLMLYTDGLVERRGRPLLDGLEDLAESGAALRESSVSALVTGLLTHAGDERDDVCVLVVAWPGGDPRALPSADRRP